MVFLLCLALQASTPDDLVRRLGDESGPARDDATKALRAMGEEALPALRRAEAHPDAEVRARVGQLLLRIEWLPWIDPALLNRYPPLREFHLAADHAGVLAWATLHPSWEHGFATHLEAYSIRLLDHPDAGLRKAATKALSAVPDRHDLIPRRPVAKLVELISRWDPEKEDDAEQEWLFELAFLARRRLSKLDRPLLTAARARHPEAEKALVLLRAAAGDLASGPTLVEIAVSDEKWKGYLALELIHELRYEPARPALLEKLRKTKGPRRWNVRRALAAVADPSCASALLEGLPPAATQERASHLDPLVEARLPEALPAFLESARKGISYERGAAFRGLAALRAPEAFDLLCDELAQEGASSLIHLLGPLVDASNVGKLFDMLECPNDACRSGAGHTLGLTKDPDAQAAILRRFEEERRPEVRENLYRAVTVVYFLEAGGRGVEDALERIVRDAKDRLAPRAAAQLLRMKGRDALPLAESIAETLEAPPREILNSLATYPSDRMVPLLGRWQVLGGLERLGTPAARAELERLASRTYVEGEHRAAACSLFRAGGDGSKVLGDDPYWSIEGGLLRHDFPVLREILRKQFRERGATEDLVWAASNWAHPEMIPALRKLLETYDQDRRLPDPKDEIPLTSGVLGGRWTALDALNALAATGDRSLIPYFLSRLEDFEYGLQEAAVRALGRHKAREAVPALRRIVRSGHDSIRAEALEALGEIGGPGVEEFLRSHLRDNPHAAPYALARLGVRCPQEIATLLDDRGPAGPIVGALDLMENPAAYSKIDLLLPPTATSWLQEFPEIVRKLTGISSRLSPGARAAVRAADTYYESSGVVTLRDAFHALECGESHAGGRFTHLYRDDAIEICTVEEAAAYWRKRLGR